MAKLSVCCLLMFLGVGIYARPHELARSRSRRGVADPDRYLERFGYLVSGGLGRPGVQHSEEARSEGIRQFQKMVGIEETGMLNEETLEWMDKPRCGMPDRVPEGAASDLPDGVVIAQSYTVPGSRWTKNFLTYKIHNFSPDLYAGTQRRAFHEAFKYWSDVANLEFRETSGKADINIRFAYGVHGDGQYNGFDGQGGILAHAFFPESGETHFDEGELWTDGEDRGSNLAIVAAHELGHALGLAHSAVHAALMAPYYAGYIPNYQLHPDDIAGIQLLYGPRRGIQPPRRTTTTRRPRRTRPPPPTTTTTTRRPTTTTRRPRRTRPPPPTTTTTTRRPTTTTRRPRRTRPPIMTPEPTTTTTTMRPTRKPTTSFPDPCTTKFDAVFYGPDYKIYVLKSEWVYRLGNNGVERGFPILARTLLNGWVPQNIGGAAFSRRTRRLYLFKGKQVWRYQFNRNNSTFSKDPGFPRTMASSQYPKSVDSVITDRAGHIYLFKHGFYYTFSEYYLTVDRHQPRTISSRFTGIPDNIEAAVRLRDGYMYFFKGTNYRKFLDGYGVVAGPKAKAGPWMACGGAQPK
ncbi:interstitial collagenase-like [Lineus longissimus]|uniref:interstitial collagenase-like n=1 Tax=Lineus longissimus TaxID=88925 RepID=UPI002B4E6983